MKGVSFFKEKSTICSCHEYTWWLFTTFRPCGISYDDNGLLFPSGPNQLVEPTAIVIKVSLIPAINSPNVGKTSCVPLPSDLGKMEGSGWSSCFEIHLPLLKPS